MDPIRLVLPFKDQASADIVRAQLKDLSHKIQTTVQPVFVSQKIERDLKLRQAKPPIVNQQWLVYKSQCDLCDAGYVGFTRRHLHQRVEEHKNSSSSIGKHFRDKHSLALKDLTKKFYGAPFVNLLFISLLVVFFVICSFIYDNFITDCPFSQRSNFTIIGYLIKPFLYLLVI